MNEFPNEHRRGQAFLRNAFLFLLLLSLLAGCAGSWDRIPTTAPAVGTVTQLPSATVQAVIPSPAVTKTETTPTLQPTPSTSAPGASLLSEDERPITIALPWNGSALVSPLILNYSIRADEGAIVQIELVGKSKLIYARQILDLNAEGKQGNALQATFPFETVKESEPARLTVRLLNDSGITTALSSINLTLLRDGESRPALESRPGKILIQSPVSGQEIGGKKVHVMGLVTPMNDEPVVAQLLDEDGIAINTKLVSLPEGQVTGHALPLEFMIPYSVPGPTPCRLTLYQASYNQIEGLLMLTSIPVTLLP